MRSRVNGIVVANGVMPLLRSFVLEAQETDVKSRTRLTFGLSILSSLHIRKQNVRHEGNSLWWW